MIWLLCWALAIWLVGFGLVLFLNYSLHFKRPLPLDEERDDLHTLLATASRAEGASSTPVRPEVSPHSENRAIPARRARSSSPRDALKATPFDLAG